MLLGIISWALFLGSYVSGDDSSEEIFLDTSPLLDVNDLYRSVGNRYPYPGSSSGHSINSISSGAERQIPGGNNRGSTHGGSFFPGNRPGGKGYPNRPSGPGVFPVQGSHQGNFPGGSGGFPGQGSHQGNFPVGGGGFPGQGSHQGNFPGGGGGFPGQGSHQGNFPVGGGGFPGGNRPGGIHSGGNRPIIGRPGGGQQVVVIPGGSHTGIGQPINSQPVIVYPGNHQPAVGYPGSSSPTVIVQPVSGGFPGNRPGGGIHAPHGHHGSHGYPQRPVSTVGNVVGGIVDGFLQPGRPYPHRIGRPVVISGYGNGHRSKPVSFVGQQGHHGNRISLPAQSIHSGWTGFSDRYGRKKFNQAKDYYLLLV